MKNKIMYMEPKGNVAGVEARIGRITVDSYSQVINYRGKLYQPHKDRDAHANYYEIGNGTWYWISHCQKDGMDSIEPRNIVIDDDVQKEYWEKIRRIPESVGTTRYQSPGKVRR